MAIDRKPTPPQLNEKAKELITELCFRKNDALKKVDGIFVYASITGGVTSEKSKKDLKTLNVKHLWNHGCCVWYHIQVK